MWAGDMNVLRKAVLPHTLISFSQVTAGHFIIDSTSMLKTKCQHNRPESVCILLLGNHQSELWLYDLSKLLNLPKTSFPHR